MIHQSFLLGFFGKVERENLIMGGGSYLSFRGKKERPFDNLFWTFSPEHRLSTRLIPFSRIPFSLRWRLCSTQMMKIYHHLQPKFPNPFHLYDMRGERKKRGAQTQTQSGKSRIKQQMKKF
jgi:hypothetical protein